MNFFCRTNLNKQRNQPIISYYYMYALPEQNLCIKSQKRNVICVKVSKFTHPPPHPSWSDIKHVWYVWLIHPRAYNILCGPLHSTAKKKKRTKTKQTNKNHTFPFCSLPNMTLTKWKTVTEKKTKLWFDDNHATLEKKNSLKTSKHL